MDIQAKIDTLIAELEALEKQQAQNQNALQQTQIGIHQRHGAIIALRQLLEPPVEPSAESK